MKDRGKALQAIVCLLFPTEGYAALAPGYQHRKRCVQPSRLVVVTIPMTYPLNLEMHHRSDGKYTIGAIKEQKKVL